MFKTVSKLQEWQPRSALMWAVAWICGVSTALVPVHATDLSYNYGSIGYANFDGFDGWSGGGSYEVGGSVRIAAGVSRFDTDAFTLRTITFGAGYIARLTPEVDVIVDVGFLNAENQIAFFAVDEDEWGGFGGLSLRFAAGDRFELEPSIAYTRLFDAPLGIDEDDFVYGLTGRVLLGGRVHLEGGISGSSNSNEPTFSIGLRFGPKWRARRTQ